MSDAIQAISADAAAFRPPEDPLPRILALVKDKLHNESQRMSNMLERELVCLQEWLHQVMPQFEGDVVARNPQVHSLSLPLQS